MAVCHTCALHPTRSHASTITHLLFLYIGVTPRAAEGRTKVQLNETRDYRCILKVADQKHQPGLVTWTGCCKSYWSEQLQAATSEIQSLNVAEK